MAASPDRSEGTSRPQRRLRGERFWHDTTDAIFVLNRQGRLIYANPAWERLTTLVFAEVRGRTCRRRGGSTEPLDQILTALAPPVEARQGQACQARRRAPGKPHACWEIDYFPWADAAGTHTTLCKVRELADAGTTVTFLPEKLTHLRERHHQAYGVTSWHSETPVVQRLVTQMRLAAQTTAPVLLHGPPGSGKTWAARTIHQLGSKRALNFAVFDTRLPPAMLAEMLTASRGLQLGAVFIAHVERLPRDAQALLAERLLSENAEPRLLAGATANLDDEVRAGRFIPELHFRLSALTIQTPALAERLADLPALIRDLLPRAAEAAGVASRSLNSAALQRLLEHGWPENLRELHQVLCHACRRAQGEQIDVADLPFYLQGAPAPPEPSLALDETLAKVERRLIETAMRISHGNRTSAASLLGIWRQRLTRRLEQLGMEPGDAPADDEAPAATPPNPPGS